MPDPHGAPDRTSLSDFIRRHGTAIWLVGGTLALMLVGAVLPQSREPFKGNQADCMDDVEKYGRAVLDMKTDSAKIRAFLLGLHANASDAGMSDKGIDVLGDYMVRSSRTNGRFLYMSAAVHMAWRACASRGDKD